MNIEGLGHDPHSEGRKRSCPAPRLPVPRVLVGVTNMKGDGIGSSLVLVVRQEAGRYVGGEIIGVPTPLEAAYQGYTEGVKAGSD